MNITPLLFKNNKQFEKINFTSKKEVEYKNSCADFLSYPVNYYLNNVINPKSIEFTKAKTLDEAFEFGKRYLGIERYYHFKDEDLDVLNFINEGLACAKNISKSHLRLPDYIDFSSIGMAQMQVTNKLNSCLTINRDIYSSSALTNNILNMLETLLDDGVFESNGTLNPLLSTSFEVDDFAQDTILKAMGDLSLLSYDEKIQLYTDLRKFYEKTSNLNKFPKDLIVKMLEAGCWGEFDLDEVEKFKQSFMQDNINTNFSQLLKFLSQYGEVDFDFDLELSKYRTIFHELGHLQSYKFNYHPVVSDYSNPENYNLGMKEWLSDKDKIKAAFSITPYACYGVPEFIAEAYACKMQDKNLCLQAQKLYTKLGGPRVVLYK